MLPVGQATGQFLLERKLIDVPHASDRIRPIAICLFSHDGRILVAEGLDPVKGEKFYRPIGGAIEFGERGAETLIREVQEELKAEISSLRYLGAVENIFTYNGQRGHEIVLVYDGSFVDPSLYERVEIEGREHDGSSFRAVWRSISQIRGEGKPIYPSGLAEMLAAAKERNT
jgi:8-oxo-dGTP pyrophosphatase MutT (NUDIX family)